MKCRVEISRFAAKRLEKMPRHIQEAYLFWVATVERSGIIKTRMLPGYHDEPLKGGRKGQRSVRLSKAYRVIYEESDHGEITIIGVMEISKHEY